MLLLKNGTIHIGNGSILENTDILIDNGKLVKIAKNINHDNIRIIDAEGMEVFPGFIDALNCTGCKDISSAMKDDNENSEPLTPYADIKYSFNPQEVMMEELYKIGITTIGATPGNNNVTGGKMAAFKTYGKNTNKMLIKESVGLKGSVISAVKTTYGSKNILPRTRMGAFNLLQKIFKNPENFSDKEIIEKVINGEIPFFVAAETQSEIESLFDILKEFANIKFVICYAYQADRCVESIKKHNASIIIGEQIYLTKALYSDTDLSKLSEVQSDKVLLSFSISGLPRLSGKVKYLWNAARFHEAGYDSEEILKMMTLYPAKMLGIEDRVGTLEEGKDANIVIYSSNPIKYYNANAKYTILDGEVIFNEGGEIKC